MRPSIRLAHKRSYRKWWNENGISGAATRGRQIFRRRSRQVGLHRLLLSPVDASRLLIGGQQPWAAFCCALFIAAPYKEQDVSHLHDCTTLHYGMQQNTRPAPVVRKGSDFESIFCDLSPPVLEGRVAGQPVYPLRRCEHRFKREPVCPVLNEPEGLLWRGTCSVTPEHSGQWISLELCISKLQHHDWRERESLRRDGRSLSFPPFQSTLQCVRPRRREPWLEARSGRRPSAGTR